MYGKLLFLDGYTHKIPMSKLQLAQSIKFQGRRLSVGDIILTEERLYTHGSITGFMVEDVGFIVKYRPILVNDENIPSPLFHHGWHKKVSNKNSFLDSICAEQMEKIYKYYQKFKDPDPTAVEEPERIIL